LIAQLDAAKATEIASRTAPATITLDDVLPAWLSLLEPDSRVRHCRIVIDGIDGLVNQGTLARTSDWLPPRLPPGLEMLLSVRDDGVELPPLDRRADSCVFRLGDLTAEDATNLVRSRLSRAHKAAPDGLIRQLASRSQNPRWLVVATQLLVTLSRHDYLSRTASDMTNLDPEQALHLMLEEIVSDLSPSLDELYEDVIERLGERFDVTAIILWMLGVATFGLRDSDLIGAISLMRPIGQADLALARSLLTEMVDVVGDRWTFAHSTVSTAVEDLIATVSQELGLDTARAYRRALARHLNGLPIDDPVREQELLLLLLWEGEYGPLARGIASVDFATPRAITNLLGVMLCCSVDTALKLLDAAKEEETRLAVATALFSVGQYCAPAAATRLYDQIERLIRQIDRRTKSRFGVSANDLLLALPTARVGVGGRLVTGAPLVAAIASAINSATDMATLLRSAQAVMDQLGETPQALRLWQSLILLIDASLRAIVVETISVTGDGNGAQEARELLDAAHALGQMGSIAEEFSPTFQMLARVAESCCAAVWPGLGFASTTTLVDDAEALVRDRPGEIDALVVVVTAYRLTAITSCVGLPDDPDDWDEADARGVAEAIDAVRAALWRLDSQLALTPDSAIVNEVKASMGLLAVTVLAQARMHPEAWAVARWAVISQVASQLAGAGEHLGLLLAALYEYLQTTGSESAEDVIAAATGIIDQQCPPEWASGEPRLGVEIILLAAALKSGFSLGGSAKAALAAAERVVGLFTSGVLPQAETPDFADLIEEQLATLAEDVAELAPGDYEEAMLHEVLFIMIRLQDLRAQLS
jgi:hypothetical protein